ncbi:MAG: hypothetical protein LBH04_06175, partial [Tannerellaceae bacterium]|nr:hypothetical protein [Tannerellaceae bacterium]
KKDSVATPDYSYFRLLRDSIYVDKGSEFIIPQINNDLFYLKEDSIYTLARDYEPYFGIETIGYTEAGRAQSLLTGTLILRDRNTSSIHLAYITVSLDNILNGGTMEMQLYSNIPFHNLQSLFGKK